MKKFLSKTIDTKRKKQRDEIVKKCTVIESDEETLIKFIAGESYYPDDITKNAKEIVLTHKQDYATQFLFLDKIPHFRKSFEAVTLQPNKPFVSILSKAKGQWALMCIIQEKTETEQVTTKEKLDTEQVTTNEKLKTEPVTTNEKLKTEQVTTNEKPETEQVTTKEKLETEEVTTNEKPETEQVTTNEKLKTEQVTTKEKLETEQVTTKEKLKTEPVTTNEKLKTEQVTTNEKLKTEQVITNEKLKTEQVTPNEKPEKEQVTTNDKRETKQVTTILYKDPCGNGIPEALEMQLDKKFKKLKLIENNIQDQDINDESSYGPLTLRNLNILYKFLLNKPDLSTFSKLQFARSTELFRERFRVTSGFIDKLSKDDKFKSALKEFVNSLPWDLILNIHEYYKMFDEELKKDTKQIDHNKIKEAKAKYFVQDKIDKLLADYKFTLNEEQNDFQLKIVQDFPKQMKQIISIFKLLHTTKVDESMHKVAEIISKNLDIDPEKMKNLYKYKAEQEKVEVEKLRIGNIEEIKKDLPPKKQLAECPDCADLHDILTDIKILCVSDMKTVMDLSKEEEEEEDDEAETEIVDVPNTKPAEKRDESEEPDDEIEHRRSINNEEKKSEPADTEKTEKTDEIRMTYENDGVQNLLDAYYKIEQKYANWKDSDIQKIHEWAKKIKGSLGLAEDEICEAIAIMDRTYDLLKGGSRFRRTQILSMLLFLQATNKQGRVCEVLPGEGKSVIITSLAAIKCLQGCKVDIITNTSLLAEKNMEEMSNFFTILALTVSTNNPTGPKAAYLADVLIGTINNFQTDYLRDCLEDTNTRRNRKFEVLILLEIDSMMINKGEHIGRLSTFYPGMEFLRYIYIKIWVELHKVEPVFVKETEEKLNNILAKFSENEARVQINSFFQKLIVSERTIIKNKLKAADLTGFPLVPAHWREFIDSQLDKWLKSALHAKYNCKENKQYKIQKSSTNKFELVPLDYLNRGMDEDNTIWVDGLRQFIELKHNMKLSSETLTNGFLSNIGYIKKYPTENIFGLTSTLGSEEEQKLLARVYKINFVTIPPYIPSKFKELEAVVFDDASWATEIALNVASHVDEERAVLAIFETDKDLTKIKEKLGLLKDEHFHIRLLEDENLQNPGDVKGGDIILATSIAEFGTNFNIVKYVDENGGLHVCVCFLPRTLRIERHLFGITARQGRTGTAQLILRKGYLREKGFPDQKGDFAQVRKKRNVMESTRLEHVFNVLVKELNFFDELHNLFIHLRKHLKNAATTQRFKYALKDLEEFFAFWVAKKNYKIQTIRRTNPDKEFVKFNQEAQPIINGIICQSPYHCVGLVKYYLRNDDAEKAKSVLNSVLGMSDGKNDEILPGIHMKSFEAHVKSGRQVFEKVSKDTQEVITIKNEKRQDYKKVMNRELDKALKAVQKEIRYVESQFASTNSDFLKILRCEEDDNALLKQIHSRLCGLKFYEGNIEQLIETIDSIPGDLDMNGKVKLKSQNLVKLSTEQDKIQKYITDDILLELRSVGIDSIYSLGEMKDVPDEVRQSALKHIRTGVTALVVALNFPPSYTALSLVAVTFISDGIIDLAMEVVNKTTSDVFCANLIKGKLIQSHESMLKINVNAKTQSEIIIKGAITVSQECSSSLLIDRRLIALNNRIINNIERTNETIHVKLLQIEFEKMSTEEKRIFMLQLVKSGEKTKFNRLGGEVKLGQFEGEKNIEVLKEGVKSFHGDVKELVKTNKSLWNSITKQLMSPKLSEKSITEIVVQFVQTLAEGIRQNATLLRKLQTTATEKIYKSLEGLTRKEQFDVVKKLVATHIVERLMATEIGKQFVELKEFIQNTPELANFANKFTNALEKKLSGGKDNNNVESMIKGICDKVEAKLLETARQVLQTTKQVAEFGVKAVNIVTAIKKRWCANCCRKMNDYKLLGVTKLATMAVVKYHYRKQYIMISSDKRIETKEKEERLKKLRDAFNYVAKHVKKV